MNNNPYADGYRDPYAPAAFPSSGPLAGQSRSSFADFLNQSSPPGPGLSQRGPSEADWNRKIQGALAQHGPGEAVLQLSLQALEAFPDSELFQLHLLKLLPLLRPGPGVMQADLQLRLNAALMLTLPKLNSSLQAYVPWCEALTRGTEARQAWAQLKSLPSQAPQLLNHPLLQLCLLRGCLQDPELEILITRLREQLLEHYAQRKELDLSASWELPLLLLAHQHWNSQYICRLSDAEVLHLGLLEEQLRSRQEPAQALELLLYAQYRPLHSLLQPDDRSGPFDRAHEWSKLKGRSELWARLLELSVERPLQARAQTFTCLNTPQDQDNLRYFDVLPYPHWQEINRLNLGDMFQNLKMRYPYYPWASHFQPGMRTLIAACASGQELIYHAACNPRSTVVGVDLCRQSLGIAAQRIQELELQERIQLYQADLQLPFECPEAPFDLIECMSALHYLQQAPQALQHLLAQLKPGGLMKLSVLSKPARQTLFQLRNSIQELRPRHATTTEDQLNILRELRWQLMHSAEPLHQLYLHNPEFHVLSHCRLMLDPPFEHAYDLKEFQELTQSAGLETVAVEMHNPFVLQAYDARFPGDPNRTRLENWRQLEAEHPSLFAPLYCAWFRKPA